MDKQKPILTKNSIVFLIVFVIVTGLLITAYKHFEKKDDAPSNSDKPYAEATLEDSPFSEPVEFVTQLSDGQYLKCIRFDQDTTPVCDWANAGYPYFIKGEAYGPNGRMTRGEVEQWNTQHTNQLPYPDDDDDDTDAAEDTGNNSDSSTDTDKQSYPTDANGPSSPTTQSNSRDSEDNEEDDFL